MTASTLTANQPSYPPSRKDNLYDNLVTSPTDTSDIQNEILLSRSPTKGKSPARSEPMFVVDFDKPLLDSPGGTYIYKEILALSPVGQEIHTKFNKDRYNSLPTSKPSLVTAISELPDRQPSISSKSSESGSSLAGKVLNLPAPTAENIRVLRDQARAHNDPEQLLAFALYLIDTVSQVTIDEQDTKKGVKTRERMVLEAQKIIKKLATQGLGIGKTAYPEAQFYLANCYGSGSIGLPVDYDKAFSLYLQASKQNHPAATYRTAVCYEIGAGTRRDYNHAMQFYRKAANLSYTIAMYKLGMILLKGHINQAKNPREGIFWLKRSAAAATEDTPHALHELGLVYEKDSSSTVIADKRYSFELFSKAAHLGYAPSQCKLGTCYEYGLLQCDVDASLSVLWYRKAADQGIPEAELAVSGWYLTGSEGVIEQSDHQAYLWARRAADKADPMGEFTIGYYTEIGIGINADVEEAKRWYMLAMSRGNQKAVDRLKELKRIAAGRSQVESSEEQKGCVIM
jgi:TPR repeat protein